MARNLVGDAGVGSRTRSGDRTPQTQKAHVDQVENSAGGFTFKLDDWGRLARFLVLGTDGGTYYSGQRKLSVENADCVKRCLADDPIRTVDTLVQISHEGRAPKNDQALFVLAMASSAQHVGDPEGRKYALSKLSAVARIGTHLFTFVAYVTQMRGWGKGLREAIACWYNSMSAERLSVQVCKYQSRRLEGGQPWSHRDLLRLCHVKAQDGNHGRIYSYLTGGDLGEWEPKDGDELLDPLVYIAAHETAKAKTTWGDLAGLVSLYKLTHESIPTEFKKSPEVWKALLKNMPVTATMRNLGVMTANGALKVMESEVGIVQKRLTDVDILRKGRVHPLNVLVAQRTYAQGHGVRGNLSWNAVPQVTDALEDAFYASFKAVEPTGKRILLGVDVSGSMACACAGTEVLSCREAAAAMALTIAKTEQNYIIRGFSTTFCDLGITAKTDLRSALRQTARLPFRGTDCALPMQEALKNGWKIDAFVVITDNETWAGGQHPHEALVEYRSRMGIPAKLIVVAMTGTNFTIADPSDAGMLDVVGFDSAAPKIVSDFIRE